MLADGRFCIKALDNLNMMAPDAFNPNDLDWNTYFQRQIAGNDAFSDGCFQQYSVLGRGFSVPVRLVPSKRPMENSPLDMCQDTGMSAKVGGENRSSMSDSESILISKILCSLCKLLRRTHRGGGSEPSNQRLPRDAPDPEGEVVKELMFLRQLYHANRELLKGMLMDSSRGDWSMLSVLADEIMNDGWELTAKEEKKVHIHIDAIDKLQHMNAKAVRKYLMRNPNPSVIRALLRPYLRAEIEHLPGCEESDDDICDSKDDDFDSLYASDTESVHSSASYTTAKSDTHGSENNGSHRNEKAMSLTGGGDGPYRKRRRMGSPDSSMCESVHYPRSEQAYPFHVLSDAGSSQAATPSVATNTDPASHVIGRFACGDCQKRFTRLDKYREHLNLHRPPDEWSFACNSCPKRYRTYDGLRKHKLKRHSQTSIAT